MKRVGFIAPVVLLLLFTFASSASVAAATPESTGTPESSGWASVKVDQVTCGGYVKAEYSNSPGDGYGSLYFRQDGATLALTQGVFLHAGSGVVEYTFPVKGTPAYVEGGIVLGGQGTVGGPSADSGKILCNQQPATAEPTQGATAPATATETATTPATGGGDTSSTAAATTTGTSISTATTTGTATTPATGTGGDTTPTATATTPATGGGGSSTDGGQSGHQPGGNNTSQTANASGIVGNTNSGQTGNGGTTSMSGSNTTTAQPTVTTMPTTGSGTTSSGLARYLPLVLLILAGLACAVGGVSLWSRRV